MMSEIQLLNEKGIEAMRFQNWKLASEFFTQSLARQEGQAHVHYMLGQCYRFSDDYTLAVEELSRATELDESHKEWFLALGIALQLDDRLDESLYAFRKANVLDQDYELAYNSAAITFRKQGNFPKAAAVYDMCIEAIIRRFLFSANNTLDQTTNRFYEPRTSLYLGYALKAMTEHAARSGATEVIFPSAEFHIADQERRNYGGLLWVDRKDGDRTLRLYLPNCFDGIRAMLASERLYYMCLENKGRALREMGEESKAREHMKEAAVFRRLFELQE